VDLRQRFVRTCREGLAQCYANRNEFARALVQLKNILDDEPKNAVVRWQAARLTFLFGQHDLALEELKKAFADDPKNPQIGLPEVNMSKFWESKPVAATDPAVIKTEQAANVAKSEEWMKKAVEAYKADVRAHREHGRWLMNHARLDDADKALAAASGIDANDDETNAFIGLAARYRKDYKKATEIFRKLEGANRGNIAYGWNYALSLAESSDEKDRVQAISIANNIAQGNQKSPEAFAVLAYCLFKNNRLDDADGAMGQAIRLSGGRLPPDNIYYLAMILKARGKKVEARDRLKVAVESKDAFVFRKDAEALHAELVKEFPEEKKPEDKKP
jgi:tetratricopeptide (TPR) repeat protein